MHINFVKACMLAGILLFADVAIAQKYRDIKIYPEPKEITFNGEWLVMPPVVQIKSALPLAAHTKELLNTVFKTEGTAQSVKLNIQKVADKALSARSGAYKLEILKSGINIEARDERAVFYALQTLLQMVSKDKNGQISLPLIHINDFPDVAYRGTVEGFYGEPWSYEDRMEQLRFYGKLKLNTYIYGPKDDPYHSSPHWRLPYPEDKASQIRNLVLEARKNQVDFVWAIHPGKDIQWNLADSLAILKKFEVMYGLGVRSFAVFFDDISGIGTDAQKQAGLLNYIQYQFINKKKDITPLVMCPTEYNKSWADPKSGTYLDILGNQLDQAVHIMWTGDRVVGDITQEGLEWVNSRIKRPAYVWWNFPVSDYVRDHLLMGPSYGLDTEAAQDMSGFVSNPMDKAEASKVAVFGVALYSWNLKSYQPQEAWEEANRYIMPEAPEAFRLFNSHNSDPGPNGHRYRREESAEIKSFASSFSEALKSGNYQQTAAQKMDAEFLKISAAAKEIKSKSTNKRLLEQIDPWLQQFDLLGEAGHHALKMAESWNSRNFPATWASYLETGQYLDRMAYLDSTQNKNPYQPGVKTGSLVLTPFVKEVFTEIGNRLSGNAADKTSADGSASPNMQRTVISTNSEQLINQPLQISNASVALSPLLEVVQLKPGAYFGFGLAKGLTATRLQFNLQLAKLSDWGVFEHSADGQNWEKIPVEEKGGKGKPADLNGDTQYIRFRNASDTIQSLYLKIFKADIKALSIAGNTAFIYDGSAETYTTFKNEELLSTSVPADYQDRAIRVLLHSGGRQFRISALKKNGKTITLYDGNSDFVEIDQEKMKKVKALHFSTVAAEPIRIYEITKTGPY